MTTGEDKNTDAKNAAISRSAEENLAQLNFNPCIGVETAVLDLQNRVAALEKKVK